MTWKIGAALLVSLALCGGSPTVAPPCACPFNLRPVCGSDGVTYDSDCMLECLNPRATVQYRGECGNQHVPCVCTLEDAPVCGTNDRTYPNECSLNCDKQTLPDLAVRHTGACKEKRNAEERRCACPFIHRPVCGSDGVTYDNDCMLQCLNPSATAEYRGECGNKYVPCICTHEDKPVCGTNDRTYPNECFLNCEKTILADLTVRHTGACKEKRSTDTGEKQCVCPLFNLRPICASDGRTYDSECDMECQNPNATVEFYGACENRDLPPCICEDDDSPVCGTNDRTYPNECELNCDKSVPDLTLAHKGACKHQRSVDVNRCSCPAILRPVCGSDGVTYDNDCILKCMNPSAKLEYYGGCGDKEGPPCVCPDLYSPVCGTNDRTYPNECDLNCEKTILADLTVRHTGACKEKRSTDTGEKQCVCPLFNLRPICASDGRTYDSECDMECQNPNATVEFYGACENRDLPPCICEDDDSPVCGTNDRTYPNECELNCDKSVPGLTLAHKGACKHQRSVDVNRCSCPAILRPVCGSDGVTYDNDCILKCMNPSAKLEYYGGCGDKEGPPCVCPDLYSPVCGTNDRTYPNECDLKCDKSFPNLAMKHTGVCKTKRDAGPENCGCPLISRPVCGSDGVTYDNDCLLKCKNPGANLDYHGRCGQIESVCVCPDNYEPVCGTNSRTYSNECELKCDKSVSVLYPGVCKTKRSTEPTICACPFISRPVCASDGKTYDTDCEMRCEDSNLKVLHEGPCKTKRSVKPELCSCPAILLPVCGTDGVTYPNDCLLKCQNPSAKVRANGPCKSKRSADDVPCGCSTEIKPVCGNDGKTYSNPCEFNCEKSRTNQENLHIWHNGSCETGSDCTCTLELDAVCGSDGKIYPNPCMFECAKKKNPELSQRNRGPCKAISKRSVEREEVKVATPSFPLCDCRARIKKEVCGTDGVTYVNDCFLDCAKTSQPTLTEAHKGPCEDKVTVVNNVPNERTPCVCLERILHEVCGTDGETYANDCFFDCAKTKNKELGKAHEGRCDAVAVVGA